MNETISFYAQSIAYVDLIVALINTRFEYSKSFLELGLSAEVESILKKNGIGNPPSLQSCLYLLLNIVIQKEHESKDLKSKTPDESNFDTTKIEKFLESNLKSTTKKSENNYLRRMRNSVSHFRVHYPPQDKNNHIFTFEDKKFNGSDEIIF